MSLVPARSRAKHGPQSHWEGRPPVTFSGPLLLPPCSQHPATTSSESHCLPSSSWVHLHHTNLPPYSVFQVSCHLCQGGCGLHVHNGTRTAPSNYHVGCQQHMVHLHARILAHAALRAQMPEGMQRHCARASCDYADAPTCVRSARSGVVFQEAGMHKALTGQDTDFVENAASTPWCFDEWPLGVIVVLFLCAAAPTSARLLQQSSPARYATA
jgi:hypothetical protein